MRDPYEVLGIKKDACQQEIREAYLKLVKKLHPDQYTNNPLSHLAEEHLKEINAAYEQLRGVAEPSHSEKDATRNKAYSNKKTAGATGETIEELAKRAADHICNLVDEWNLKIDDKSTERRAGTNATGQSRKQHGFVQTDTSFSQPTTDAIVEKRWWMIFDKQIFFDYDFNTNYGRAEGTLLFLSEKGEFGFGDYKESDYWLAGPDESYDLLMPRVTHVTRITNYDAINMVANISANAYFTSDKKYVYDKSKCDAYVKSGAAERDLRLILERVQINYTLEYLENVEKSKIDLKHNRRIRHEIDKLSKTEILLPQKIPPIAAESIVGAIGLSIVVLLCLCIIFMWGDFPYEAMFGDFYPYLRIVAVVVIIVILAGNIASIPIAFTNYFKNLRLQELQQSLDSECLIEIAPLFRTVVYRDKSKNAGRFALDLAIKARSQAGMKKLSDREARAIMQNAAATTFGKVFKTLIVMVIVLVVGIGSILPSSPFGSLLEWIADLLKPLFS